MIGVVESIMARLRLRNLVPELAQALNEGKIVYIEQGSSAIDPTGAETACSRAAHKK